MIRSKISLGRVRGQRASELVCGLIRSRFDLEPGRIPVHYHDTVADYLIFAQGPRVRRRAASILNYVQGCVDALIAVGVASYCPQDESEIGRIEKA